MAYVHYADDVRIENRYPHMDRDEIKCGFDKARRIFNKYVWWYLITPDSDKELQDIRRVSAQEVINRYILDHQDDPCRYLGIALKNMIEGA